MSSIPANLASPSIIADSFEFTNSIDEMRKSSKKKNPGRILLPLLFDPEYISTEVNPITGDKYHKYKLKTLDASGIRYEVQALDFGDYIISSIDENGDPIVEIIERKTISDLIASFTATASTGPGAKKGKIRIDKQVEKCIEGTKYYENARVSLLIEDYYQCRFDFSQEGLGIWIPYKDTYSTTKVDREGNPVFLFASYSKRLINPASLLGKIASIERKGVAIIRCGGANHAYRIIMDMINRVPTEKRAFIQAIRRKPSRMDPHEETEFFIQGAPQVAGGISRRLLEKYPRPIDMFTTIASASTAEDVGVRGFGKAKFDAFKALLTRRFGENAANPPAESKE
jgi:ERCC4-type nuclease